MQSLSEKAQFPQFIFPQLVQRHSLGEAGKYISADSVIAHPLRNISTKIYHNWLTNVRDIGWACQCRF